MKRRPITKARRMRLIQMHGDRCINCGSPDEIEWHHVVPLEVGGYDVDTNVVPLCYSCHKAVTHQELLIRTTGRPHKAGGKKRTIPENYKEILHDYLHCIITKTECQKRLGLSLTNKGWISESSWFKEYLQENNICKYRNNLEVIMSNGKLVDGKTVGYILYANGTKECMRYNAESYTEEERGLYHAPRNNNQAASTTA